MPHVGCRFTAGTPTLTNRDLPTLPTIHIYDYLTTPPLLLPSAFATPPSLLLLHSSTPPPLLFSCPSSPPLPLLKRPLPRLRASHRRTVLSDCETQNSPAILAAPPAYASSATLVSSCTLSLQACGLSLVHRHLTVTSAIISLSVVATTHVCYLLSSHLFKVNDNAG